MKRDIADIKKEGIDIAEKLGNGIRYNGPQMYDGKFEFHVFTDDFATRTTFVALSLEGAKDRLIEVRKSFNAPLPNFRESIT